MFIEVGGGDEASRRRPGWKQQDVRPLPGVDFCCDCWDIDKHVGEGSVDGIYSRHVFEHMTFHHGGLTLDAWRRVLKPGGEVEIVLPNLSFHVSQLFLKRDLEGTIEPRTRAWSEERWKEHAIGSIFGWQRESDKSLWDVHKSGYDCEMLERAFAGRGFTVKEKKCREGSRDLHYVFAKG